jgi:hypothetical protein
MYKNYCECACDPRLKRCNPVLPCVMLKCTDRFQKALSSFWWGKLKKNAQFRPRRFEFENVDNDLGFSVYQVLAAGWDYCILYICS